MLIIKAEIQRNAARATLDSLSRAAMVLALGIPLSLCIKLIYERRESAKIVLRAGSYLLGAGLLILYYFYFLKDFKMISLTRFIALNLALYLVFLFIPYFFKRDHFEFYVIRLLSRFFVTIFYSLVLFGGLSAICFTLDKLLNVNFPMNIYYYIWLVVAGFFAPCFFLAGLPYYFEHMDSENYPKLLKILLLYIVTPLISIYTAILYLYFAKILITVQWPIGLVAHLVLWYSLISIAVIFLISPLRESNKWAYSFIFWFTKLVIPLMVMMFISIGIRIKAYGITENRYFVVVIGLWAVVVMFYLGFSKNRRNIVLPITLAAVAVLSVVGPWSAYSVSKASQNNRLYDLLSKNQMIDNNKIVKANKMIKQTDKIEISQIISYFQNKHSLSDIKRLPQNFNIDDMENVFGFAYEYPGRIEDKERYFSYFAGTSGKPIDIKGYDYLFDFRNYYPQSPIKTGDLEVKYNLDSPDSKLQVIYKNQEIYSKNMVDLVQKIRSRNADNVKEINPADMIFIDENDRLSIKLVIINMNGENISGSEKVKIQGLDFYTLIKLK